jgi:hypothetical protein
VGEPRKLRLFGPFGYAQGKRDDTAEEERTHPLQKAQRVGHPKLPWRVKLGPRAAEKSREHIGGNVRTFCRDAEDCLTGLRAGCSDAQ